MRSVRTSRSSWPNGLDSGFAGSALASPIVVALIGLVIERFLFRRFYHEDPALGLLLTFGLAMVAEQSLRWVFGAAPVPFSIPTALRGQVFIGDFIYSKYRLLMLGGSRRLRGEPVVPVAANTVWSRRSGRRAEPGHGRRARNFAEAVHGKHRRAECRVWPRWPVCCWRRSQVFTRRWAPKF